MSEPRIKVNIKKTNKPLKIKLKPESDNKLNIKIETPDRIIIEDNVEIIDGGTF